MVLLGFLLADVSWWFVALCGVGGFGPGILRELGWLGDKDEFDRRTAQRAGYHAYLVTGLVAFVLVAYLRSGERHLKHPEELATLFLALLWFAWLLFNIADSLDNFVALVMQSLLAAPFFVLALVARRWPRLAGVLLLAAAISLFFFLGFYRRGPAELVDSGLVLILFLGPLVAGGVALLQNRAASSWEGDQ